MLKRRARVAIAGLALIIGAGLSPGISQTEASFVDSETATSTVSSAALVSPVITSCTAHTLLNLGLVFTGTTIVWTSPYPKAQVRLTISSTVIPDSNIVQTGAGPYTHTANLSASLLQSLLEGLLGSTNPVKVEATRPGSLWVSAPATKTLSVGGLLGLAGSNSCY